MRDRLIATFVGSASALIQRQPCKVYWITVSPGTLATQAGIEIYDGFDIGGRKAWRVDTGQAIHVVFDPPINCETGVYIRAVDTLKSYTVGYAPKKWPEE